MCSGVDRGLGRGGIGGLAKKKNQFGWFLRAECGVEGVVGVVMEWTVEVYAMFLDSN